MVAGKDPDSGLADYELALSMEATASDAASLKGLLVASLVSRCRQSLTSQEVAKASADYAIVVRLDSEAAGSLVSDFEKLPVKAWGQIEQDALNALPDSLFASLPIEALTTIGISKLHDRPNQVLERFPLAILAKLKVDALLRLTPSTIAKLPGNIINQLPMDSLQTLPPTGIRKLNAENLLMLPAEVIKQIPVADLPTQTNSIGMKFKLLPSGRSKKIPHSRNYYPNGEILQESWKEAVVVENAFEIGVFEVTQQEFQTVIGFDPFTPYLESMTKQWEKFNRPLNGKPNYEAYGPKKTMVFHQVKDIEGSCNKLNNLPEEKAAGYTYRPATFAEWHYACRAGITTIYPWGDDHLMLRKFAYHSDLETFLNETRKSTRALNVGSLLPNRWGLYDMLGNFAEAVTNAPSNIPYGKSKMVLAGQIKMIRSKKEDFSSKLNTRVSKNKAFASVYSQCDSFNGSGRRSIVDKKCVVYDFAGLGGAALRLVRVKIPIPRDSTP